MDFSRCQQKELLLKFVRIEVDRSAFALNISVIGNCPVIAKTNEVVDAQTFETYRLMETYTDIRHKTIFQ